MPTTLAPLPALTAQADRLIELGLHQQAGLTTTQLYDAAAAGQPGDLLVLHHDRVAASVLAPLLQRMDKPGFVVEDMTDVDLFVPIDGVIVPPSALYLLRDVSRGDEMANWSPDEALPAIEADGRTPLTLTEGIHWALQQPDVIERNHCYMTIGSRLPAAEAERRTRRAHARTLDQQRHRA
ncbi:DUF5701 family protein [Nocardioides sp. InS609-2]|uniref:DUF5701 family protein n=1 Tax=Nocardioides sp. InS609-2 TaxID=2760705 RepID=UPI0020BFE0F8|nr:DUF5701 family protein [Nocardioides sp. InS609-2]